MRFEKILSSIISLLIILSVGAFDFSRINVAWKYDPLAEIEVNNRMTQNGDEITLFLRFRAKVVDDWNFEFWVQPRYESESHRRFKEYQVDTLLTEDNRTIIKLTLQKPEENLMVVKIFQDDVIYYHDVPLKNGVLAHPSIYPINQDGLPIF